MPTVWRQWSPSPSSNDLSFSRRARDVGALLSPVQFKAVRESQEAFFLLRICGVFVGDVLGWLSMEDNWVVLWWASWACWISSFAILQRGSEAASFWCWVYVSTQFCLHAVSFHMNPLEARGQPSPRNLRLTRGVVAKIGKGRLWFGGWSFSFHSRKLTWHLKMNPGKRRFFQQPSFFGSMLVFQGVKVRLGKTRKLSSTVLGHWWFLVVDHQLVVRWLEDWTVKQRGKPSFVVHVVRCRQRFGCLTCSFLSRTVIGIHIS